MSSRSLPVTAVIFVIAGLAACLHRAATSRSGPLAPEAAARTAAEGVPTPLPAEAPGPVPPSPAALKATPAVEDFFRSRVRPILERRCTPCHFSGGQMYDRLPFDKPDVVRSKSEMLLRRLRVVEEHRAVEDWLHTPPPAR